MVVQAGLASHWSLKHPSQHCPTPNFLQQIWPHSIPPSPSPSLHYLIIVTGQVRWHQVQYFNFARHLTPKHLSSSLHRPAGSAVTGVSVAQLHSLYLRHLSLYNIHLPGLRIMFIYYRFIHPMYNIHPKSSFLIIYLKMYSSQVRGSCLSCILLS